MRRQNSRFPLIARIEVARIRSLLYKTQHNINDGVYVRIPTVGEVLDHEEEYYTLVSMLTSDPIDMMAPLDDAGIDFTTINDYDLFLLLFTSMREQDTSLIFGELDLSCFRTMINEQNGMVVLRDEQHDIVIDRMTHNRIAACLREIHGIERNLKTPANEEAKRYMIERARVKARRHKGKESVSQLEPLIVAMVNTEQFRYGYAEVRDLSIYQFNRSVRQIINKVEYEHRMHGVYAGTVSIKDLSPKDLDWISGK